MEFLFEWVNMNGSGVGIMSVSPFNAHSAYGFQQLCNACTQDTAESEAQWLELDKLFVYVPAPSGRDT